MVETEKFLKANPDDKDILIEAGIQEASCLVVGTKNDIVNLSIMITAKKLNPDIYLIARENTMQEISIFQAANIDWVFMIERILINKTSLALTDPLKHRFLKLVLKKDEIWAKSLVKLLTSNIGANPELMTLIINEELSYAIYHELLEGKVIEIEVLLHSLANWKTNNSVIPLLIKRDNEELLLPKNRKLEIGDKILLACDKKSKEEIALIASNIYELHYAQFGKEKQSLFFRELL
jgi:Trk K+ transport system NAD-binding subunit